MFCNKCLSRTCSSTRFRKCLLHLPNPWCIQTCRLWWYLSQLSLVLKLFTLEDMGLDGQYLQVSSSSSSNSNQGSVNRTSQAWRICFQIWKKGLFSQCLKLVGEMLMPQQLICLAWQTLKWHLDLDLWFTVYSSSVNEMTTWHLELKWNPDQINLSSRK